MGTNLRCVDLGRADLIMNNLPTGKGKLSSSIRDLDQRVKRLEPRSNPGNLVRVDPTGVNIRPRNLLMGRTNGTSNNLPRYR